ncbi:MAG: NAD(P)-dependent oxidoreductase, partial [bacterium]|nr:NAD(P)-dependent oxidoreductase [bacterium]
LETVLGDCHGLIATSSLALGRRVLEKAPSLQVVGIMGAGRPMLDLETATRRGVLVINAPGSVAVSVAEHTFALILGLARKLTAGDRSIKRGAWHSEQLVGKEIRNKVLGIIGFGAVGTLVAERAIGLGMKVLVCDPHLAAGAVSFRGCRQVGQEELFRTAHVITLHAPLTEETKHMICKDTLDLMKNDALLVNCSETELIDEAALLQALEQERLGGAGLDLQAASQLAEHRLYLSEKVICTPGLSARTEEALSGGAAEIAQAVVDYLERGAITHAVNVAGYEGETRDEGLAWLTLSEKMGLFVTQLHPYGLKAVAMHLAGEDRLPAIQSLTQSALKGILSLSVGGRVNLVNARSIAAERGIRVSETRTLEAPNYRNLVTLSVETESGKGTISGTLFGARNPRVVEIDGYGLEAVPHGDFLVIFNRDRPGVIADVAQTLGEAGINIAQMYNGRDSAGGKAITLMRIDSPVADEKMALIRGLPNILSAARVDLAPDRTGG